MSATIKMTMPSNVQDDRFAAFIVFPNGISLLPAGRSAITHRLRIARHPDNRAEAEALLYNERSLPAAARVDAGRPQDCNAPARSKVRAPRCFDNAPPLRQFFRSLAKHWRDLFPPPNFSA